MKSLLSLLESPTIVIHGYVFKEGDRYITVNGSKGTIGEVFDDKTCMWKLDGMDDWVKSTSYNWVRLKPLKE